MKISNFKIGTRLLIAFAALLLMAVISTAIGVWNIRTVALATHEMTDKPLTKERLVSDWFRNNTATLANTTAIIRSSDPSLDAFFKAEFAERAASSNKIQEQIASLLSSDQEKAAFAALKEVRKQFMQVRDKARAAKASGDTAASMRIFENDFLPTAARYRDALGNMLTIQRDSINANAAFIDTLYQRSLAACRAFGFGKVSKWRHVPMTALRPASRIGAGSIFFTTEQTVA